MNWTILSTVLGVALIVSATIIKIAGTGRRESCMKKFTDIATDQALTKNKFEQIEKQLQEIKEKQDRIDEKIDKLMFLLPKRISNNKE